MICFEENARGELLSHLGFDSAAIATAAEEFVAAKQAENGTGMSKNGSPTKPDQGSPMVGSIAPAGASAADVFGVDLPPPAPPSPKPTISAGSSPLHAAKTAAAAAMMSPETSAGNPSQIPQSNTPVKVPSQIYISQISTHINHTD